MSSSARTLPMCAGLTLTMRAHGLAEAVKHHLVHGQEPALVLDGQRVTALEVDDVDGAGGGDRSGEGRGPRRLRVELEAQVRIPRETATDRALLGRVAEPERVDEAHRRRNPAERLRQAEACLCQRQIEGGGLEGPPSPATRHLP